MKNFIYQLFPSSLVDALGMTLLHSLWQGALVALAIGLLMVWMRKQSSNLRYTVAAAGLLVIPLLAVVTFMHYYRPHTQAFQRQSQALTRIQITNSGNSSSIMIVDGMEPAPNLMTGFDFDFFASYFSQHFPLIVTIWFLGVLIFTLRLLGGIAYVQRLKSYAVHRVPEDWQARLDELCDRLEIDKSVELLESKLAKVPMVIGHLKPVILLPVGTITGLPTDQVEAILSHELAHVARHDYLMNIGQSVVETLFFYHPAVWWVSSIIRSERENCCDDLAVALQDDSLPLAKALANVESQAKGFAPNWAMAANGRGKLYQRVNRLLTSPRQNPTFKEGFISACLLMAAVLVLSFTSSTMAKENEGELTEAPISTETKKSILFTKSINHFDFQLVRKIDGVELEVFDGSRKVSPEEIAGLPETQQFWEGLDTPFPTQELMAVQELENALALQKQELEKLERIEFPMKKLEMEQLRKELIQKAKTIKPVPAVSGPVLAGSSANAYSFSTTNMDEFWKKDKIAWVLIETKDGEVFFEEANDDRNDFETNETAFMACFTKDGQLTTFISQSSHISNRKDMREEIEEAAEYFEKHSSDNSKIQALREIIKDFRFAHDLKFIGVNGGKNHIVISDGDENFTMSSHNGNLVFSDSDGENVVIDIGGIAEWGAQLGQNVASTISSSIGSNDWWRVQRNNWNDNRNDYRIYWKDDENGYWSDGDDTVIRTTAEDGNRIMAVFGPNEEIKEFKVNGQKASKSEMKKYIKEVREMVKNGEGEVVKKGYHSGNGKGLYYFSGDKYYFSDNDEFYNEREAKEWEERIERMADREAERAERMAERMAEQAERRAKRMEEQQARDYDRWNNSSSSAMEKIKSRFKNDGIIDRDADRLKLKVSKGKLVVNGKTQSAKVFRDYAPLLSEYFGTNIEKMGDDDSLSLSISY